MDFLKNINFKELSAQEDEKTVFNFDEVNRSSNIPFRFATTVLKDGPLDEKVRSFATEENSDKVLLLGGNVGTGKTTLLCGAMHERAMKGLNAGLYLSCRTLGPKIRSSRSFSARVNEEELYEIYSTIPFLVIDELGRSDDDFLERTFVSTLLALRYDNCLPTAIGTNLSPQSVREFLNEDGKGKDIIDRLSSVLVPISLDGNSFRKKFQ